MVFILSAIWWVTIRGLWKFPDGRDWLWGKLSLALVGKSMFSKSLVQFSADGWGYVPSLWFGLRLNCSGGNRDLLQNDYASIPQDPGLLRSVPLSPRQATVNSRLHQRLLNTHRQVWLSLLWDNCSFLLGPCMHRFCICLSRISWVSVVFYDDILLAK